MPVSGVETIAPTENHSATGDASVDALLSGSHYAPDAGSSTTTVTFSFGGPDSVYSTDPILGYDSSLPEPVSGVEALSTYAQGLFRSAVENLGSFSNLALTEVTDTDTTAGTVRIAWTGITDEDAVAWAYLPAAWYGAGDIWLLSENHAETDTDFFHTILHELGHALGLKHSFETSGEFPAMDAQYEGVDYTVMSYTVSARFPEATWSDLWPQTYMYWDILALQEIYGVDTETTAGAQTYDFDQSARHYLTVWDYAGNDTIGASGGSTAVDINLTPGSWVNVGTSIGYWNGTDWSYDSYTVYIADDTIIENAYGAGGNDKLTGNDAANQLTGNDGADRLLGQSGNDTLEGGAGADTLRGDTGDDVFYGGDGNDQLWAGSGDAGNDTVIGGAGDDITAGAAGNDLLVGDGVDEGSILQLLSTSGSTADDGADIIYGGSGNDTMIGGSWDDSAVSDNGAYDAGEAVMDGVANNIMFAGTGDDLMFGAAGNDVMGGGTGDDSISGGDGNDTIYGGAGDAEDIGINDVMDGGAGDDDIYASVGNDSVDGGDGNDLIFGGAGNDTIDGGAGDDNIFSAAGTDDVNAGAGDDTLWGGGGDDSFTGGADADTFIFASTGDDTITDFNVAEDELRLVNTVTDFTSTADVTAAASEQNGGLLIDLGGGNSLFLEGLSISDIDSMTIVL